MKFNKIVVAGGGVLGSQIAYQAAYSGKDVTIWLRSESSIGRTQPKLDNLHKEYEKAIKLMDTPEGKSPANWCRGIAPKADAFDAKVALANSDKAYKSIKLELDLAKACEGADLIIVDTAGRLQNKQNLMNELAKIKRVMSKEIPDAPHETFLIIDATTGQNGVIQAKAFAEVTDLTGIVITKMDGTSKGGIILAIRDELGIPVRFIGLGEKFEDLKEFDIDSYLYGLCVEK